MNLAIRTYVAPSGAADYAVSIPTNSSTLRMAIWSLTRKAIISWVVFWVVVWGALVSFSKCIDRHLELSTAYPNHHCGPSDILLASFSSVPVIFLGCTIFFDLVIYALMVYKLRRSAGLGLRGRAGLLSYLLRDGMVYVLLTCVSHISL